MMIGSVMRRVALRPTVAGAGRFTQIQRPTRAMPALAQQLRFGGGGVTGRERMTPMGKLYDTEEMSLEISSFPSQDEINKVAEADTFQERGRWWVRGQDFNKELDKQFGNYADVELPFYPRKRIWLYGNYAFIMKMEYCFFYIPTFLVLGLCMPGFAMLYAIEDAIDCDMVVKVVGRQWYWVYEVESPTGDDDEDEDDD